MEPLISIIIPIYNAGTYLENCIESALCQTYSNIEIILIDDGSFDASIDIEKRYANKYEKIQCYSQKNQGVGKTRQLGVLKAAGEYICFLDADDLMEQDMIEKMISLAIKEDADIVNCGFYEDYSNKKSVARMAPSGELNQKIFLMEMFFNRNMGTYFWNRLWKKELFEDLTISEKTSFEDLDTISQLVLKSNKIVSIEQPLYHYIHQNEMSIMNRWDENQSEMYFDAYQNAKKHICEVYPELDSMFEIVLLYAAMNDCKALYKNKKSNKKMLKRIKFDWEYIAAHKGLLSGKKLMEAEMLVSHPKIFRSMLLLKKQILTFK